MKTKYGNQNYNSFSRFERYIIVTVEIILKLELSSENKDNRAKEENVDEYDWNDWEGKEDHWVSMVHPTQLILVVYSVNDVGDDGQNWDSPAENQQPGHPQLLFDEGLHTDHPEECALAHHPEVGCQHEVGGHYVQHSAPHGVLWPHVGVEQDKEIPEKPGYVVEAHAEEHVDVNGVAGTSEGGEGQ